MTDDFNVATRRYGPVVYLAPEGDLDVDTAPLLEDSVEALLEDRPWVLVVDLGRVDFIDSSGLRALLTCKDDAEHTGGCLQVREVQAFPMTRGGQTAAMKAPKALTDAQLKELGLSVNPPKGE